MANFIDRANMKILLAVDGSAYTGKAAKFVASHLEWFRGKPELHLLHVKLPLPIGLAVENARKILGDDAVNSYYKEEALAALAPAEEILRKHHIPFQAAYKIGDIPHQIQSYVSTSGIDMIVMGSHGHSSLANVMLGSISTKVLATTTVPVLIVR
jgi:nucleotide-binding universal stress UspA family protein